MSKDKTAHELIQEIFDSLSNASDEEYCNVLEEIAGACEDASIAKRHEMNEIIVTDEN